MKVHLSQLIPGNQAIPLSMNRRRHLSVHNSDNEDNVSGDRNVKAKLEENTN